MLVPPQGDCLCRGRVTVQQEEAPQDTSHGKETPPSLETSAARQEGIKVFQFASLDLHTASQPVTFNVANIHYNLRLALCQISQAQCAGTTCHYIGTQCQHAGTTQGRNMHAQHSLLLLAPAFHLYLKLLAK